jgi:polysaccharide export outer membrane protein
MNPTRLACAILFLAGGCASPPHPPPDTRARDPAPPASVAPTRYLLAAGDEIDIRVPDRAELNQVARVRPDGQITIPLLGAVRAAERSPEEVEAEITRRFRELGAKAADAPRTYLIAVGDTLEIKFANHPELNQVERVRPDGKISLPLVKTVAAEGRSPEALESDLIERFSKVLKRVDLVVIVKEYTSQKIMTGGAIARAGFDDVRPSVMVRVYAPPQVFVGGEVARPGVLAYRSPLTAMQAIVEAGGDKPTAEMRGVMVVRKAGAETPRVMRVDLREDLDNGTSNDFALQPNDVVIVPKSTIASVAQALDQYVFQILPPLRNSSFAFIYDLRGSTTTTLRTQAP